VLGMCYILCMCVWVCQIQQLCLTIPLVVICVSCAQCAFLGGASIPPPPGYMKRSRQRPEIFLFGQFLLFLAVY
jgi:hypothetical protein